jgi:NAD(P)-dependent dehydrogenase (short-subunit alcohol dehydrogenase family)
MEGKTCLITGGSSGVGKATAIGLARLGASVVILSKDTLRGERVACEIRKRSCNRDVRHIGADLSLQASIRDFADNFKRNHGELHVLGNMAGSLFPRMQVTQEGIEMTLAVDYLSHFLLTHLLLDLLKEAAPSRIITISGGLWVLKRARIHLDDIQLRSHYSWAEAAMQAALARFIFSSEIAKILRGTGVTSNSFNPGKLRSRLARNFPWYVRALFGMGKPFLKSECETCIYLAAADEMEEVSGKYILNSRSVEYHPKGYTEQTARRLWNVSKKLTGMS